MQIFRARWRPPRERLPSKRQAPHFNCSCSVTGRPGVGCPGRRLRRCVAVGMAGGKGKGSKLGHAVPNGGRGGMLSKGPGFSPREAERQQLRRTVRVRNLERPDAGGNGAAPAAGEPSPVYRDRRALTRRGRQLMDRNVHASWRELKKDGEMMAVAAVAVCLLVCLAAMLDLQALAQALAHQLPLGPEVSESLLAGMRRWTSLELGCWGAAALLLSFFTWLLYAALFDTIGMVMGLAPAVAAGTCVFVGRVTPFLCSDTLGSGLQDEWVARYCSLAWTSNPRLLVGSALLVVFASGSLSAVGVFAVRERLPGPDHRLALLSLAILAAVGVCACSAPGSWQVVQQVRQPSSPI
eukprot:jgi/Tetstr1/453198/TSEL_040215.t1